MQKPKRPQPTPGGILATFTPQRRAAIIAEVFEALHDAAGIHFLDAIGDHDRLRTVAAQLDVPFLALHMLVDGRVSAEDVARWQRVARKAVA